MARNEATSDDQVTQWGTFRLGDEIYGVNVMQIREVLRYTEITPVPGAPYYVLGIINLRGNVVTVIDTRTRFGLNPGEIDNNTRIVIVEVDKQVIGMLVDSSIVVLENIFRHRDHMGQGPRLAAREGADEMTLAIGASTITTIVVFLPVALVEGRVQFFLLRLALPLTVSLSASLFVALIFIPPPRRSRAASSDVRIS